MGFKERKEEKKRKQRRRKRFYKEEKRENESAAVENQPIPKRWEKAILVLSFILLLYYLCLSSL